MADERPPSLQERVETSDWGRALISAFIGITLATLFVIQLPGSHLRREALRLADPYSNAIGIDQDWSVFAPDPRRIVIDLEARVAYADGSTAVWHVPRSNDVVGSYWDYRWLKFMETVNRDVHQALWAPLTGWVARTHHEHGAPVRIDLIRSWYDLYPPGAGPNRGPWHHYRFFTLSGPALRAAEDA